MALLPPVSLQDEDKLHVLQRLDQFRTWRSLDEKRYCLSCAKLITGRDIQVIGGTRGNGPLRLICPTKSCHSIPMDWVLPTDEVLAKYAACQATETVADPANGIQRDGLRATWHKFASQLRRKP